jgi:hypothetical protein
MLLLGPLGFRLLFPFDMRGGPAIFVFGPIFLAIVWGIFAVVLAIWVVARPDFVSRLLSSLGYALLLNIAWLAVVWTYSAATYPIPVMARALSNRGCSPVSASSSGYFASGGAAE